MIRQEQVLVVAAAILLLAVGVQAVQIGGLNTQMAQQQGEWVALLSNGGAPAPPAATGQAQAAPQKAAPQPSAMVGGC